MTRRRRTRPSGVPEPVEKVLGSLFKEGKFGNSTQVAELWTQWNQIVGEDAALHCAPEKIADGKLYIRVDNPIWHQQLDLLKEELHEKVIARLPNLNVDKIIFRTGAPLGT